MTSQEARDPAAIRKAYEERRPLLVKLAATLEAEVKDYLAGAPHIDRAYFRAKDEDSFVKKAMSTEEDGSWKYSLPLEEIEDQVAGRVLVFYRSDVSEIMRRLEGKLKKVERTHKKPASAKEFDYETVHTVCAITVDLRPEGWSAMSDPPSNFELQVRTLAQHAWSEPQHEVYKKRGGLPAGSMRKLYWAAASAWGMDSIWDELRDDLRKLEHLIPAND